MGFNDYPQEFLLQNASPAKQLNVVVEVEGYAKTFSTVATYKAFRYGEAGYVYGGGQVYGGLIPDGNSYPYLSINSSLIISQKVEPEQGRASSSVFTLEFLDKDGFMSNFITPNQQLDEILGGKLVKIRMGYQNTSYPEDYFVIFRGYVSMTTTMPTKVMLQLTDANVKRRAQIFFTGKTKIKKLSTLFHSANLNDVTDTFTITNHLLQNGNVIRFYTDSGLPAGITADTDYYVVNVTSTTFQISATFQGAVLNFVGAGSGTMQFVLQNIGPIATVIPLYKVDGIIAPVLGPDGTYDPTFTGYIFSNNEIMSYTQSAINSTNLTVTVQRGALSTVAQSTAVDADVEGAFGLQGNVIDLALKTMLSGWGATWITAQSISSFGYTNDATLGVINNAMVLPNAVDGVEDYGLSVGDYVYVSSGINAGTYTVSGFIDVDKYRNKIVLFDQNISPEANPTATFSTRSQYDTLPPACGNKLRPIDLDVAGWQKAKSLYAFQSDAVFRFFIKDVESCKEWIESQLLLPVGAYSVTRFGRISCAFTKPPLASDRLVTLSALNIINPQNITVSRGLNDRRYFSEIQYYYDVDVGGNFTNILKRLATDALSKTTVSSVLPIKSNGLRTDLSADTFIARRSQYLLSRYKGAAYTIRLSVNFEAGVQIEVSDVVAVVDQGGLQITNLETGNRDLEAQLFEVQERYLNLVTGQAQLTLLSQIGYQISDRFGGISPSSLIVSGTTTDVLIKDSFGALYPNNEQRKWLELIGERIVIHSPDFSFYQEVTLFGFDAGNPYRMLFSPALTSTPQADWIVNCAPYPANTTKNDQAKTKLLYAFIDPTISITSGSSTTVFSVDPARASEITAGLPISVNDVAFSQQSSESIVDSIAGSVVTLKTAIEFVPAAGMQLQLIGFPDANGPFRIL